MESAAKIALRLGSFSWLLFLFTPICLILVYAFNASNIQTWPIAGLSLRWFGSAFANEEIRTALCLSLKASVTATSIALLLGSAAAFAVHRFTLLRQETVSFFVVLPIALPGIITGMALNSFFVFWGIGSVAVDDRDRPRHLLHRHRLQQRDRAPPPRADLARGSLDGSGRRSVADISPRDVAHDLDVARRRRAARLRAVLRRGDRHHLTAGAQNTLPLWIFGAIRLGQRLPEVNVVVLVVIMTVIPVVISQRLARDSGVLK